MSEMINSIIEAVRVALDGEFGKNYEIYTEEPGQGFKEPCFFIFCLKSANELFRGQKYFRRSQFCVRYFPESIGKQRENNDVAERMWQCLEYITIDGEGRPIRGTKMNYEVVDGVLNFFVNYDCFVYKTERQNAMEELLSDTGVKGGD